MARVACMRAALLDQRLRLVAQPIIDLRSGQHVADEVLLRLVHPDGRVDLPSPYLRAAERYSLVTEVDAWVLDRAAGIAAKGRRLHVNLSGRTLTDCAFADCLETTLDRHGADPSLMTFEITETAPLLELPVRGGVADRIARLGAHIAIDDFGTGYGSLSYLHHLPVSTIKIDAAFGANIVADEHAQALVEAVVQMAEHLGLTTIAEGVGDDATLTGLRWCGVDLAQGFHIGVPESV